MDASFDRSFLGFQALQIPLGNLLGPFEAVLDGIGHSNHAKHIIV